MFHKHIWGTIYDLPDGKSVRGCTKCDRQESRMFDYYKQTWKWIFGNYWVDERPIFILAGNFEEFIEARQILNSRQPPIPLDKIWYIRSYESIIGVTNPTIVFYGTWYSNGILEDERLTHLLNHRR